MELHFPSRSEKYKYARNKKSKGREGKILERKKDLKCFKQVLPPPKKKSQVFFGKICFEFSHTKIRGQLEEEGLVFRSREGTSSEWCGGGMRFAMKNILYRDQRLSELSFI